MYVKKRLFAMVGNDFMYGFVNWSDKLLYSCPVDAASFAKGADISWVPGMEEQELCMV